MLCRFVYEEFVRFFGRMNLKNFKMFKDEDFEDVSDACSSEKVSICGLERV